jgi:hypothetical protein
MSRELLKEAAQALETVQHYFPAQDEADKGLAVADVDACQRLMTKIEAYLAEPEPDAIRILEKVRDTGDCWENQPAFVLPFSEAAALIESYGRRVPQVFVEEILDEAWNCLTDRPEGNVLQKIAAKHGVKLEDAK